MIKYYTFTVLTMFVLLSCKNDNEKNNLHSNRITKTTLEKRISTDSIEGAYLSLDKTKFNFGKIKRKKTPSLVINFEIENIGKEPLIILKADVSCGCISVEYPKQPILPNKKMKLTVTIDTRSQKGEFNKTIFLKSNADNDVVLIRIVGEVK